MKYLFSILLIASVFFIEPSIAANDGLELPSWASSGNLESEISQKGQSAANILSLIVAILAVIGMLIGAGFFTVGNQDKGKTFLIGGILGLLIAGSVFGIASIFIG